MTLYRIDDRNDVVLLFEQNIVIIIYLFFLTLEFKGASEWNIFFHALKASYNPIDIEIWITHYIHVYYKMYVYK